MRNLYASSDEKFVKAEPRDEVRTAVRSLDTYQFRVHPFLEGRTTFNKNKTSFEVKTNPNTLLNLCVRIVNAFSLPPVYTWTNVDVCVWIRKYGYPQYRNTFEENMINGRTLLLLDAAALSAMNIKNFDHIKHIAKGIRGLFFFELTKFSSSISLPPHYYYELYKLYRVKTGLKFEQVKRTDLWRKMQLLREQSEYHTDWEILEKWLSLKPDPIFNELFGGFRRYNLYKCREQTEAPPSTPSLTVPCTCEPPCICYSTDESLRTPWRLSVVKPDKGIKFKECSTCIPPCQCNWKPICYKQDTVLSCLLETIPHKYKHRAHNMNIKFRRSGPILVEMGFLRRMSRRF